MILLASLANAIFLIVSAFLLAGAGKRCLGWLRYDVRSPLESLLFALTLGTILLELAVTGGELIPNARYGVIASALVVAVLGLSGLHGVLIEFRVSVAKYAAMRGVQRFLASFLFLVLVLQWLASLAPLSGSDALHYHFAVPALYLSEGFHANWSLLHGFFCGLGHQLILAGLALGSASLAQQWLFLGGAMAALATFRLTNLWTGGAWPWLAALAFALTPVAFWQTTAAGAPDIWMCALLPLCLLAIPHASSDHRIGASILAGVLAGAVAGTKYTGILLASVLLVAFLLEARSLTKSCGFLTSAVVTGFWPFLRNWFWTGDPVFPFFFVRMHHGESSVNETALGTILVDVGAAHAHSFADILRFPLFAAVDPLHIAPWQLLGPLILAFGPLAVWQVWSKTAGRAALLVWFAGALAIAFTSAMPRFLLPLLPVALAVCLAGIALLTQHRWPLLRALSVLSLVAFLLAGFAAMVVYSSPAWSTVVGRTTQEDYLLAQVPDYQRSQFVNREVQRFAQPGRTLLFFRHLYYLRVPFFSGDPEDSWDVNPQRLTSSADWQAFFARNDIRWVLKSPAYPKALAESLARLEQERVLVSCASGEVESFAGNRMEGKRVREPITLFCVQP